MNIWTLFLCSGVYQPLLQGHIPSCWWCRSAPVGISLPSIHLQWKLRALSRARCGSRFPGDGENSVWCVEPGGTRQAAVCFDATQPDVSVRTGSLRSSPVDLLVSGQWEQPQIPPSVPQRAAALLASRWLNGAGVYVVPARYWQMQVHLKKNSIFCFITHPCKWMFVFPPN